MIPVLSRQQVRGLDQRLIGSGVPGLVLMENAGRGAVEELLGWSRAGPRVLLGPGALVLAGPGNNGGDAYVVARRLRVLGGAPRVLGLGRERLTGDAAVMAQAYEAVGGRVEPLDLATLREALPAAALVVDGLFGTGLDRPLSGEPAAVVQAVRSSTVPVVALDLPSGLCADRGVPLGASVRASLTLTFAAPKPGLFAAPDLVGELRVVDIGAPAALPEGEEPRLLWVERAELGGLVPPRPGSLHKGSAGRVLVVGGAPGTVGAAVLAARGAHRAGAGLVTVLTWPEVAAALDARVVETMTARLDPARPEASLQAALALSDSVVLGPGLGRDERAERITRAVLDLAHCPVVVDADALFHVAKLGLRLEAPARVATPHAGELARLLGVTAADLERDRLGALRRAVDGLGATVMLKGAGTLIGAPGEIPRVVTLGHPALASGGSGDVLAGIVGALLPHLPPLAAATLAAGAHGVAARRWVAARGDRGLLASELADELPGAFRDLGGRPRDTR